MSAIRGMHFDGDRYNDARLKTQRLLPARLFVFESRRRGEQAVRWFAELCFKSPNDGQDIAGVFDLPQEKFTAGCFGQSHLCRGVDRSQVVRVPRCIRQFEQCLAC